MDKEREIDTERERERGMEGYMDVVERERELERCRDIGVW